MGHVRIYLLKATFVHQAPYALAGSEFALSVLRLNPIETASLLEPLTVFL
jgi:hypothetical protein